MDNMKQIYQIHNIGIFIDTTDKEWSDRIQENIKVQFDGFEIYNGLRNIEYSLFLRNMEELDKRNDAIVVPECSKFYPGEIMRSDYTGVAYQIGDKYVNMWTSEETWYAPYLLEILFVAQGMAFVHGASVAVDGKEGKLLLAFGGIGKTCFIANAAKKKNVTILGDDLILVSKTGELFSYPRPFCLYEYHKALFPQYFKTHKVKYVHIEDNMYFKRFIRKMKKWLHIKDTSVYHYLTVSPVKLFPANKVEVNPVMIKDVYILRRNQASNKVCVGEYNVQPEYAKNFALDVILHEWDVGLKVLLNKHAQTYRNIQDYIQERNDILSEALAHAGSICCVDIPEKMNASDVSLALNKLILEEKAQ